MQNEAYTVRSVRWLPSRMTLKS